MKEQLYKCVADLEGGDWCVGIIQTEKEWKENAIEWADSDGYLGVIKTLKKLKGQELIDFIKDFWQIRIVEVKGENEL